MRKDEEKRFYRTGAWLDARKQEIACKYANEKIKNQLAPAEGSADEHVDSGTY
ncbi:hypothetical protein [Nitrosomonas sp.]|uniref:hypothetical protein n=1 Tax=Nitrosomonas sp. TaxID=42353 RepID=UPI0032EAB992